MASAAAVTPLRLLHMRSLQHWLHSQVPRWAWHCCTLWVNITQECRRSFSPWMDLAFYGPGALRTSVLPCYCYNRCLQHGLRRYMQQAGSLGALDWASTALAHQLHRAVGSASTLAVSYWTQQSWNSCRLRQRSWPRSLLYQEGRGPPSTFGEQRGGRQIQPLHCCVP